MHILVINVFFSPNTYGGATIVAEEVAKVLARERGVQVTAISAISRSDLQPYAVVKAETHGIPNYQINLPQGRRYQETYRNADVASRISTLVSQLEPDLAHVHCIQDIGADCIATLKAAKIPVVLSVHDFWWLCERQFMIRPNGAYCGQDPIRLSACRGCVPDFAAARTRHRALAALGELADLITYPSEFARRLSQKSGFAPNKGIVLENGVRTPGPGFFDAQADRRAKDARLVFGFVGGPSRIKGWPQIHDAFATIARDDFAGLLVEGSRDASWWRDIDISRMRGSWSIHPRFEQANMDAFYARIDVLLFMSQWKETFGLTIREALSRGIRVIQTDGGGTVEHNAAASVRKIPLSSGSKALRAALNAELDARQGPCDPVMVTTYRDQADALLRAIDPLVASPPVIRSVA